MESELSGRADKIIVITSFYKSDHNNQELMEEDLKRELERNELATKMALAKEQEAQEAKRRFVLY